MKLFFLTAAALVASASAKNAQCTDTPSAGEKFEDPSPISTLHVKESNVCCARCAENTECEAWSFTPASIFDEARCYLHSSATLPKQHSTGGSCATHTGPEPSPAPAPATPHDATNWVVIAAGSSSYANYRHQADACHAYQIAKKGGIPESNIILMMEDDVAGSDENPYPGKLFNKPTDAGTPGVDVYDGCVADYKGSVVTAKLFTDVLTGNSAAVAGKGNGKVLKSGPKDKVFINFVDHGGAGIIEFPNGDFLHAKDLNTALQLMHTKNMYEKVVFYMEACESGSMFEGLLPTDINIYATTAANAKESSWGTYCPPQDKVDGKDMDTCLGDLYSVNWMEDADTASGLARTLEDDYTYIKKVTNKSHVMQYGTQTFTSTDKIGDYLSEPSTEDEESSDSSTSKPDNAVDTHDIELVLDFYKYLRSESRGQTAEERDALASQLIDRVQARQAADARFASLPAIVADLEPDFDASDGPVDADCVKAAYNTFRDTCGAFDSYTLKYSHQIADLCLSYSSDSIEGVITSLCTE